MCINPLFLLYFHFGPQLLPLTYLPPFPLLPPLFLTPFHHAAIILAFFYPNMKRGNHCYNWQRQIRQAGGPSFSRESCDANTCGYVERFHVKAYADGEHSSPFGAKHQTLDMVSEHLASPFDYLTPPSFCCSPRSCSRSCGQSDIQRVWTMDVEYRTLLNSEQEETQ